MFRFSPFALPSFESRKSNLIFIFHFPQCAIKQDGGAQNNNNKKKWKQRMKSSTTVKIADPFTFQTARTLKLVGNYNVAKEDDAVGLV